MSYHSDGARQIGIVVKISQPDLKAKTSQRAGRQSWIAGAAVVLFLFGLLVFRSRDHQRATVAVGDVVRQRDGWASETSCIECHSQAESFADTGHARTLSLASSDESLTLLRTLNQHPAATAEGLSIKADTGLPVAVSEVNGVRRENPLAWCFGSGTHARTWVSALSDSRGVSDLMEFRYSWFAASQKFDVTPGQPNAPGRSAVSCMGVLFDGNKARRCFACHATVVTTHDGKILDEDVHAGVTCQRCHGPRAAHVASDGEFHPDGWQIKDRLDAVLRCAVCHRLKSEKTPEEIVPSNPGIVRFQPMGLMESACYLNSKMTCTTCHDPHVAVDQQDSRGIWQCTQCHDQNNETHTLCGLGKTDDCLRCHMPAVEMSFPVRFTDHWIRVRKDPADAGSP